MANYPVGAQVTETVTVTDKASGVVVDPATFTFTLKPPADGGYVPSTYTWNGSTWTSDEAVIAVPSRTGVGTFVLRITNLAQGAWGIDWKHTANGGGLGEGGNSGSFVASKSAGLP
jgi:hypothetical protein